MKNQLGKRTGVLLAGLLAAAIFVLPATPALAAQVDNEDTTATIGFTAGALTLEQAPTISFGTGHAIDGTTTYAATAQNSIQVEDLRGSGAGWKLNVAMDPFSDGTNPTLTGAYMEVTGCVISSEVGNPSAAPTCGPTLTVNTDSADVTVLTAADNANAGMGLWTSAWPSTSTNLHIVMYSSTPGTHTADLHWTLLDTPA